MTKKSKIKALLFSSLHQNKSIIFLTIKGYDNKCKNNTGGHGFESTLRYKCDYSNRCEKLKKESGSTKKNTYSI